MRNLAPEIFSDEIFGTQDMMYRVLWIGLIVNVADDQGRMLDNPALIRSLIFPYDESITIAMIDKGLSIFAKKHKLLRYVAGTNGSGRPLIQIINWWKHQRMQWAARSIYPAPAKWVDRVRTHIAGRDKQPYTLNWDKLGGYLDTSKSLGRDGLRPDVNENENVNENKGGMRKTPVSPARPRLAPKNLGRGEPKGHANLKRVKSNGNR